MTKIDYPINKTQWPNRREEIPTYLGSIMKYSVLVTDFLTEIMFYIGSNVFGHFCNKLTIKRKCTNYFFQSIHNNTKHKLMQMLYFESIIIRR